MFCKPTIRLLSHLVVVVVHYLLLFEMIRALSLLALLPGALGAYCSGSPDEGTRTNENPISYDGENNYV